MIVKRKKELYIAITWISHLNMKSIYRVHLYFIFTSDLNIAYASLTENLLNYSASGLRCEFANLLKNLIVLCMHLYDYTGEDAGMNLCGVAPEYCIFA